MTDAAVIFTTLGDAGGIGPELVAKSLGHTDATAGVKRLIVGPRQVFEMGCEVAGVTVDVPVVDDIDSALANDAPIVVCNHNPTGLKDPGYGESTAAAGASDLAVARLAAQLHERELVDGFVFAPVNKLSLKMGGRISKAIRRTSPTSWASRDRVTRSTRSDIYGPHECPRTSPLPRYQVTLRAKEY